MRVLITGGFGFIGGRLAHYLCEANVEVILGTRKNTNVSPEWLPQSQVIQTKWEDLSSLKTACNGVDVVIHTAGMNAGDCKKHPVEALRVNGLSTANLLYCAISSGVKKLIYVSTGHVYNNPLQGEIAECDNLNNIHPYASSHRAGEDIVRYAHQKQFIEGVVIRLSNSYGTPMHKRVNCWMLLVNGLCRQAVKTGRMSLLSSGVQHRDFFPISSLCKVLQALIVKDRQTLGDGLFNLGCGKSMSVWDMACLTQSRCEKLLDKKVPLSKSSSSGDSTGLNYVVQKLKNTGIDYDIDHINEIDSLLNFCVNNFSELEN